MSRNTITWKQVKRIRKDYAGGLTVTELAEKYGLRQSHVSQITNRDIWDIDTLQCKRCGFKIDDAKTTNVVCAKCKRKKQSEFYRKKRRKGTFADFGGKCALCSTDVEGKKWARHHISYDNDTKVLLCNACHLWLHGQARIFRHPLKGVLEKDMAPYVFAKRVVELYENNGDQNELKKAIEKAEENRA